MRLFATLAACLALASAAVGQQLAPPVNPAQVTVIRAGTLIDPRAETPLHNQLIIIHGDIDFLLTRIRRQKTMKCEL